MAEYCASTLSSFALGLICVGSHPIVARTVDFASVVRCFGKKLVSILVDSLFDYCMARQLQQPEV